MKRVFLAITITLVLGVRSSGAQPAKKPVPPQRPQPTVANLSYGSHQRQVLDFWKAKANKPTALVLYIHGGGWQGGDIPLSF
jgi:acetyl esterase/lipase